MDTHTAEVIREYGPFADAATVHGVSYDGRRVWYATGERMVALDPHSGQLVHALDVAGDAGTAFDGRHLYQIVGNRIHKLDPDSGRVLADIPAPEGLNSGMAWAEGSLWVGQYRARRIHQVDPATGNILRTIPSNRHVTGITWVDGELWHGTWEDDASELLRIDPATGSVLMTLQMPKGMTISGVESDGAELIYCGGGDSGKVRAVRRPRRAGSTEDRDKR